MKKFLLLLFFSSLAVGQDLNNYKYALVPTKFEFQKEADQFRLNTYTKMFMEKYGFETKLDTETMSSEFVNNACNKVYVNVENTSSSFVTRLKVILKDCQGAVLFVSKEGRSKEKEFKVSYVQALRDAFSSFDALKHSYNGKEFSTNNDNKGTTASVKTPEIALPNTSVTSQIIAGQYYAQPIANGYQIIDSEPKVIYKIYKTSTQDFYIATKGTSQGVFFLRNNEWFFESYQNDKLVSEKVAVKF